MLDVAHEMPSSRIRHRTGPDAALLMAVLAKPNIGQRVPNANLIGYEIIGKPVKA